MGSFGLLILVLANVKKEDDDGMSYFDGRMSIAILWAFFSFDAILNANHLHNRLMFSIAENFSGRQDLMHSSPNVFMACLEQD